MAAAVMAHNSMLNAADSFSRPTTSMPTPASPPYQGNDASEGNFDYSLPPGQQQNLPPPYDAEHLHQPASPPRHAQPATQPAHVAPMSAEVEDCSPHGSGNHSRTPSNEARNFTINDAPPQMQSIPYRQHITNVPTVLHEPQAAIISSGDSQGSDSPPRGIRHASHGSMDSNGRVGMAYPQLQYHHQPHAQEIRVRRAGDRDSRGSASDSPRSSTGEVPQPFPPRRPTPSGGTFRGSLIARPASAYSSVSDIGRGRSPNHLSSSPNHLRAPSANSSRGFDSRPVSYVNLLNVPYPQPAPAATNFTNNHLRPAVGANASLLSNKQTLEMYRTNAKKTNDPDIQYEFALFMVSAAQEVAATEPASSPKGSKKNASHSSENVLPGESSSVELLKEARAILTKLSDRGHPFAQYYLADGLASGLFHSKGKEDWDRAFPLFVSAAKHGHAESCYRAALCFEYGWGCRKDPAKAEQFYRQGAARNHPGAMTRLGKACILGDMGLVNRHREGLKWLRRASDAADVQYNSAPFELGLLHELGFYDYVFQDESYAAQLYTQAAELGHAEAGFKLGQAYELGQLSCPVDAALSVHFYTGAASQGHAGAMMALCAWYLVGCEGVLERDELEGYEWALRSAEAGLAKAQYAVGYFKESGIGTRIDALEANVWYVRAADQGDERAVARLATIRAAASGETDPSGNTGKGKKAAALKKTLEKAGPAEGEGPKDDKDCIVM